MTTRHRHSSENRKSAAGLAICLFAASFAVLFPALLAADELTGGEPGTVAFEARLASFDEVKGWESVPGPRPGQTLWISPAPALTNADVAQAWPDRMGEGFCIGLLLTEEGALKLARLTREHIGEQMALMLDGRVTAAPRIAAEIDGGRALILGDFTEAEATAVAAGIVGKKTAAGRPRPAALDQEVK